jgi:hypothetical protein
MTDPVIDFQEALADAGALYERYLATARLTEFSDLACTWQDDDPGESLPLSSDGVLLDLTLTTS